MKKASIISLALSMTLFGASAVTPMNTFAEDEAAELALFDHNYDSIFVVEGTYNNQYTQFRNYYVTESGRLQQRKVVITDTSAEYSYGDILVCSDEPELTEVYPYKNVPVYSHAYYYEVGEGTSFDVLGNCYEFKNKKELKATYISYAGSGSWSFNFTDDEGAEYKFGLNYVGSHYGVDLTNAHVGDVYTFAMIEDTPILPLEAQVTFKGDANTDGTVSIADPVAILQHIANRDKYELRPSALVNADVDGVEGVTANDARVLQEWDANKGR